MKDDTTKDRHFVQHPTKDKKKFEIDVDIDLPDEVILRLALIAHEQNITLNELCVAILREYIKKGECGHEILDGNDKCICCNKVVKVV